MPLHSSLVPSALAFALIAALPTSASAQAQLYIDVATHTMPGMPGLGALGRLSGAMSGGNVTYGMTQHPGMPGKYMDVALYNVRAPGTPAEQAVPGGLGLGNRIDLLPPPDKKPVHDGNNGGDTRAGIGDGNGTFRIRYYWGCGEATGAGQPREYSVTVHNGKVTQSGRGMAPRTVPGRAVTPGPDHALWPNQSSRKSVPAKASLVGEHHVTGAKVPESMRFVLGDGHDFMPELRLKGDSGDDGMILRWNEVEGARGHFAHATVADGETIVMWSSSEDGYAGNELLTYLPEPLVAQWVKSRTLLGPDARECRIPTAVYSGKGSAPMVQMIAYGNERNVIEPRPADAARDWKPTWNVRLRNKSTAMLMPGGTGAAASPQEMAKPAAKDVAKGFLRGLIGR